MSKFKKGKIMKNLILTLLLVSGIVSCNSDDSTNCNPEIITTNWSKNKAILVEYNADSQRNKYSITEGENDVFEYTLIGAECPDIYDDEWGEILTFEISEEANNFEYSDEGITHTKCFFRQFGAWVNRQYEIKNGMIKGEKLSEDEWKITVSIITPPLVHDNQPKLIEFVKVFGN